MKKKWSVKKKIVVTLLSVIAGIFVGGDCVCSICIWNLSQN